MFDLERYTDESNTKEGTNEGIKEEHLGVGLLSLYGGEYIGTYSGQKLHLSRSFLLGGAPLNFRADVIIRSLASCAGLEHFSSRRSLPSSSCMPVLGHWETLLQTRGVMLNHRRSHVRGIDVNFTKLVNLK
ncbi:hypothetical protein J6590_051292 [Homalodisca vitripennis]|nr:hypothetical protein J6590_051292 [Homalodisca vitripennis]